MTASFRRYLRAKRPVDDRSLDRRLVGAFRERLAERAGAGTGPLRVLEVGAGIGAMLARLFEWDILPTGEIRYTAVDIDGDTVAAAGPYLREWAADRPVSVTGDDPIRVEGPDRTVELETVAAEAVAHAEERPGEFDALVGAAFLDIVEVDGLESLLGALAAGGSYYFPITFDGATRFYPSHPADRTIERYYHEHMDRKPGGSSRAGGESLSRLRELDGVAVSDVAGSDWIVRPVDGAYPGEEASMLGWILDSVETAVGEVADETFDGLDGWLSERRGQLEAGELLYVTHQLDILGTVE